MNKVSIGTLIGIFTMMGCISSVSAMEQGTGESSNTDMAAISEINKIQDPYERCVAYVKLKKLEGIDCKMKTETMKPKEEKREEPKIQKNITEPNSTRYDKEHNMNESRPTQSKENPLQKPSQASMRTGAMMESEMKYLGMMIGKLNPEQRMELMKMIRTYLESKGIKNPSSEIKKNENEQKGQEISAKEKKVKEEMRAKQEEMMKKERYMSEMQNREKTKPLTGATNEGKKEFVGHVSLLK